MNMVIIYSPFGNGKMKDSKGKENLMKNSMEQFR